MGGFRFSARNGTQVVGAVALFTGGVLHRLHVADYLWPVLVFIGFACLGLAFKHATAFKKVVAAREELAAEFDWTVVEDSETYIDAISGFPFGKGHKQEVNCLASGAFRGTRAAAFTYEFTRGHGRLRHQQEYDVVVLELPVVLPQAYLIPNDSVESAKLLAGVDRSRFELVEFNDEWSVTGPDKRYVHALVNPQLIETLMGFGTGVGPICFSSGALYTWRAKRRTADEMREALRQLDAVRERIPAFVWEDFAGSANSRAKVAVG